MTDDRERRLENLQEATGENAKSKALDVAARYYVRMAGGCGAVSTGQVAELLERAEEQGSVTPKEIAEVLDTDELPVEAETTWCVGTEE
jgi:hypothetical protein